MVSIMRIYLPFALFVTTSCFAAEQPQQLDVSKIFTASPMVYTLLAGMSIISLGLWLYTFATFRPKEIMPASFAARVRSQLQRKEYAAVDAACANESNLLASILRVGLLTRSFGPQVMIDAMKSEGKRLSMPFWQRLSLLNDIAMAAPMLGLLGTVIGMFYAFYDMNRSVERINSLFDGLGIAVGTTVAGLVVSILAMIFHSTLKYRLVQSLSRVESEALSLSTLIEG
jgi:biopolymer transport protein ExbB